MSKTPQPVFKLNHNNDGYLEVIPKPTVAYLEEFYNSSYFDSGTYAVNYSDGELEQKKLGFLEAEVIYGSSSGSMIDIGCGEGFSLDFFEQRGWTTAGVDFTADGVQRHFPKLKDKIVVGDIFASLDKLISENKTYDLIMCNNVIEHVLEPKPLLDKIKRLSHKGTLCRLQVPNDNSWLQSLITSSGFAEPNYWFCAPSHLSYFTTKQFRKFIESNGFEVKDILGDFPIELFLLNESSNYKKNPTAGKSAHRARIEFDINLARQSIHDLIAFRRGCGAAGAGRNTTIYCSVK